MLFTLLGCFASPTLSFFLNTDRRSPGNFCQWRRPCSEWWGDGGSWERLGKVRSAGEGWGLKEELRKTWDLAHHGCKIKLLFYRLFLFFSTENKKKWLPELQFFLSINQSNWIRWTLKCLLVQKLHACWLILWSIHIYFKTDTLSSLHLKKPTFPIIELIHIYCKHL